LTGTPLFGTMGVPTKHYVPRLNTELACFKLLVRRYRIERFDGMCSQKKRFPGQKGHLVYRRAEDSRRMRSQNSVFSKEKLTGFGSGCNRRSSRIRSSIAIASIRF
jgi:hypothetical protein